MSSSEEEVDCETDGSSEHTASESSCSEYRDGESDENTQNVEPPPAAPNKFAVVHPHGRRAPGRPRKIRLGVRGRPRISHRVYIPSETRESTWVSSSGQTNKLGENETVVKQDPYFFSEGCYFKTNSCNNPCRPPNLPAVPLFEDDDVNYPTYSGSENTSGSSSSEYIEGESDDDAQRVTPPPSMFACGPPLATKAQGKPLKKGRSGRAQSPSRRPYTACNESLATLAHSAARTNEWDGNPTVLPQNPWLFSGQPMYNIEVTEVTPMSILEEFLDDKFFSNLVNETNRYAKQRRTRATSSSTVVKCSYTSDWEPVNKEEMRKFIGLAFSMGIIKKPTIHNYWQKTPAMYQSDFWSSVMKRDRFSKILSCLNCNNDDENIPVGEDGHNPLFELDPVITFLQEKFQKIYSPKKQLSLGEGTCPFKSKVNLRSNHSQKADKRIIKIFELCEAESGYRLKFEIAMETSRTSQEAKPQKISDLVMRLLDGYKGKGHEVYMDQYYTSAALFNELHGQKVSAVGPCHHDRMQLPREMRFKLEFRGDMQAFRKGNVLALKWKDRKEVLMLSTKHVDDMVTKSTRGHKRKQTPVVIDEYRKHMNAFSKLGQRLPFYRFERNHSHWNNKWWHKLFFHLLSMTTINAYIVYSKAAQDQGQNVLTFLKFMEFIVTELTRETTSQMQSLRNSTSKALRNLHPRTAMRRHRLTGRHFPEYTPSSSRRPHVQRDCHVCIQKEKYQAIIRHASGEAPSKLKRSKTQYYCPTCHVALHPSPCFKIYHTVEKYSH